MFFRDIHNYRKKYLRNKYDKNFLKENKLKIKEADEEIKNKFSGSRDKALAYLNKARYLMLFNKFNEVLRCFKSAEDNIDIFRREDDSYEEIYFLKGFIKSIQKDYKGALEEYDKAKKLYTRNYLCEGKICNEIAIANRKLYGFIEGNRKTVEYFDKVLNYLPDDYWSLNFRALANYFIDVRKSIKDWTQLIEKNYDRDLNAQWRLARIKCNLKIWQTENINKQKEIVDDFEKAEKELTDREEQIVFYYYKSLFYKLINEYVKAKKCRRVAKELYRMKFVSDICRHSSKEQVKKILSKIEILKDYQEEILYALFTNENINLEDFKHLYRKYNLKFSNKNHIYELFYRNRYFVETENKTISEDKLKYIINENIKDLNKWEDKFKVSGKEKEQKLNMFEYALLYKTSRDFFKYLIEERHINYKKEKNILKRLLLNSNYELTNSILDTIKYFVEDLKIKFKKQNILLFEICRYGNFELFEYFVERLNYNLNVKNKDGNTLLIVFAEMCDFEYKQGHFDILKYLLDSNKIDIEAKNKKNETFLSIIDKNTEDGEYKILKFIAKTYGFNINKTK